MLIYQWAIQKNYGICIKRIGLYNVVQFGDTDVSRLSPGVQCKITMWYSYPSKLRRNSAFFIVATVLAIGVVLKAVRDFGILPFLLFLDVKGTSPNFVLPFCIPIGILILNKEVNLWDFVKGAFGAALGLTTYEIMQIWMPWLTFDYNDILASFLGAMMSIVFAWFVFFRKKELIITGNTEQANSKGRPKGRP